MINENKSSRLDWNEATGLMPVSAHGDPGLQGALVPDTLQDRDQVAVVYNKGDQPPEITIHKISGTVHSVLANGIAVAVVARASGPAPTVDDVLLVERVR